MNTGAAAIGVPVYYPYGQALSVQTAMQQALATPSSWSSLDLEARMSTCGYGNEEESWPSGSVNFKFQLNYRRLLGELEMGKVFIQAFHPSTFATKRALGCEIDLKDWYHGLLQVSQLYQFIYTPLTRAWLL